MQPSIWAIIGPVMTIIGAVIGAGVGWGAMRTAVADLKIEVSKLSALSSAVVGLELQTAHMAGDIAALQGQMHQVQLDVARLQERSHTGRFPTQEITKS